MLRDTFVLFTVNRTTTRGAALALAAALALSASAAGPVNVNRGHLRVTNPGTLSVVPMLVLGDFNRDGHVNAVDIPVMLAALSDLNNYKSTNSLSDTNLLSIGDINASGALNNADVQALLNFLISGNGSATPIPEPASLILLGLAIPALALGAFRRRHDGQADFTAPILGH